jgi:hypothetical protein
MRLSAVKSATIIGILLLGGGIGRLIVLHYENRGDPNTPDYIRYEWSPSLALRIIVLLGVMLLIWAGCTTLYKFLRKRFLR